MEVKKKSLLSGQTAVVKKSITVRCKGCDKVETAYTTEPIDMLNDRVNDAEIIEALGWLVEGPNCHSITYAWCDECKDVRQAVKSYNGAKHNKFITEGRRKELLRRNKEKIEPISKKKAKRFGYQGKK